jgi:hypothetical protein
MEKFSPDKAREQAIKIIELHKSMDQIFNIGKNEDHSRENLIMAISAGLYDASAQGYKRGYDQAHVVKVKEI